MENPHRMPADTVNGEREPGSHGEHEQPETLLGAFRERAIRLGTMPGRLRLITGLAFAELLGAVLILGFRGLEDHLPRTDVYATGGSLVSLATPVLVICVAMLVAAWAYLLSGAVHSHWLIRFGGLGFFTWATLTQTGYLFSNGGWSVVAGALVGGVWLVGVGSWLWDGRMARRSEHHRTHQSRLYLVTMGALLALIGGLYAAAWLGAPTTLTFTSELTLQLTNLSLYLVPVLIVAGVDFADWADLTAERLGHIVSRAHGPVGGAALVAAVTVATAGAAAGYLLYAFRHDETILARDVAWSLLAVAVIVAVVLLARRQRHLWTPKVPYPAILALGIVAFVVPYLAFYLPARHADEAKAADAGRLESSLAPYLHPETPAYTVDKPAFWEVNHDVGGGDTGLITAFDGFTVKDPAIFEVFSWPAAQVPDAMSGIAAVLQGSATSNGFWRGQTPYLAGYHRSGGTDAYEVRAVARTPGTAVYRGRIFGTQAEGRSWVLFGFSTEAVWSFNDIAVARMGESFHTGAAAEGSGGGAGAAAATSDGPTDSDKVAVIEDGAFLVVAAAAAVAWAVPTARRHLPWLATATLFCVLVLVLTVVHNPDSLVTVITQHTHGGLVGGELQGLQALAGLASIGLVAWLLARRRLDGRHVRPMALLLGLAIALQVISWIYDLYAGARSVSGQLSIAQGGIVLLALMWDVTMSGETFTNGHSSWWPRHARVSMFFGYITLVAALIVYFSSLQYQATGRLVESQFETDVWPQSGLILLGVPLVMTLFVVRLTRWRRGRQVPGPAAAAAPQHGAAPQGPP